jgi:hypothetical protein
MQIFRGSMLGIGSSKKKPMHGIKRKENTEATIRRSRAPLLHCVITPPRDRVNEKKMSQIN